MTERRIQAGDQTIVVPSSDLSRAGTLRAWAIAFALLAGVALLVLGSGAHAVTGAPPPAPVSAPTQTTPPVTVDGMAATAPDATTQPITGQAAADIADEAYIEAEWDGPTLQVDWQGHGYSTVEAGFVGDRVAVPGDHVERTLRIGNAGPAGAVMTVALSVDELIPAFADNPELAEVVELFWDVGGVTGQETFATLLDLAGRGDPVVAEVRVPQGQEVAVTVGFEMPADVTTQTNEDAASTELLFQVLATLRGDTAGTPPLVPGVPPDLAATGMQVAGGTLIAIAAGLLLLGVPLIGLRRRRCDACDEVIERGEVRVTVRGADGRSAAYCEACAPAHAFGA